jgi:hypothetical protein
MADQTPPETPRREIAPDFATALALDLAAKRMNERLLGKQIGLTQQAINKWRVRGFPPPYRLEQLREIFGPDSHVARIPFASMLQGTPRLRMEAPINVPQGSNALRVTRTADRSTSLQTEAQAGEAWDQLLGYLPDSARECARRDLLPVGASEVPVDFLSARLALEFRKVGDAKGVCLSRALLKLAAIKRQHPGLRAVLCLLGDGNLGAEAKAHIEFAESIGVEVWEVQHVMEAAAMISGIEAYPWRGGATPAA